jgi:GGDEF domain-containing protein
MFATHAGYGIPDPTTLETATALAMRIHEHLCEPIELEQGTVRVGASIGLYLIEPAERVPSAGRMHDLADGLMYEAKRAGEPLRVARTVKAAENVAA